MSWYGRRLTTFRSHGKEARKVAERDIFSSSALTPSINGIRMRKSMPASAIIRRLERIRSFGTPVKRRWLPESISFKSTRKRSVRSITLRTVSGEANKVVSTARWIPNAPQRSSRATKSDGCDNGSPPQKVTPPSERSHKDRLFLDLTHDLVDRILTAGHLHRQSGTNLGASTACAAQRAIRDDARLRQGQRPDGAGIHAGPATYALLPRIQLLRPGRDAFRVMAPYAGKRASFHEDRDTNARPVVYGVSFDIE